MLDRIHPMSTTAQKDQSSNIDSGGTEEVTEKDEEGITPSSYHYHYHLSSSLLSSLSLIE